MDTAHVWHQGCLHSVYSICSNKADRLETDRMERRPSSTGQVDRKGKVERREETDRTNRMERRNETIQY